MYHFFIVSSCRSIAAISVLVVVGLFLHPGESYATQAVPILYDSLVYTHPSPTADSFFGNFADISSQYVGVLGGRSSNSRATQVDAFIYDAITGQHLRTFTQPIPASNVNFRFASIAIDGDLAVVGATYAHIPLPGGGFAFNAGAAFVYDLNTGALLHKLVSDTPRDNFLLGSSVDILDDRIVVGGWGNAYVFDATTGDQLAELLPSADSGQFGISVAISESAIVAGSNSDESQGSFTGAVYTFDPQTFAETSKFIPTDANAGDNFGIRVAVDGDYAIASGRSAAYVFGAQSGEQFTKLTLPGNTTRSSTVAIQDTIALLGNPALGTAMTFDWESGTPINQLIGSTAALNFGFTVALAEDEALVAALGKAYQYHIVPEPTSSRLVVPFLVCCLAFWRQQEPARRRG